MPTSIWGGPESDNSDQPYPLSMLKYFLKDMVLQFGAQGACIALCDETVGQMRIHAHLRLSKTHVPASALPVRRLDLRSHDVRQQQIAVSLLICTGIQMLLLSLVLKKLNQSVPQFDRLLKSRMCYLSSVNSSLSVPVTPMGKI